MAIKQRCCLQSCVDYNLHNNIGEKSLLQKLCFCRENILYGSKTNCCQALGNQIDTEDRIYTKYASMGFLSIAWLIISVNVTIYRTIKSAHRYQSTSQCIMMTTTKLRGWI
jgi:hypothetical protein